MMRAVVAASPLLLSRAHRYLPTYSTARRTGGCKWYIHYYPQSNGWNLLGDKLLRPPTLLGEFRDSIRVEAERDTFWGCLLSSPSLPLFCKFSPPLFSLSFFFSMALFSFSVDAAYRSGDHRDSQHLRFTPLKPKPITKIHCIRR